MGAEPPVQHLERVQVVVGDVEAAQQHEAPAVFDLLQQLGERGPERRQREIRLGELERADAARLERMAGALELGQMRRAQLEDP